MKASKNEKSPYATLDMKPVRAPKKKSNGEPVVTRTGGGADLRTKGGK